MKISRRIRRSKWFKKFLAACLTAGMVNFTFLPAAWALPSGGSVQWSNGADGINSITIDNVNAATLIKMLSGSGAIINWNDFSINGGKVTFNFDAVSNGAILNKVITSNPSLIAGILEATNDGKVILVNPNGIVFGGGAQINTPYFIASTIGVTDDNFQKYINGQTNNTLTFDQNTGSKGISFVKNGSNGNIGISGYQTAFFAPTVTLDPGVTLTATVAPGGIYPGGYGDYHLKLAAGQKTDMTIFSDAIDLSNFAADTSNLVQIGGVNERAKIGANGFYSSLIGGKVQVTNTDIVTNDYLDITAISKFAADGEAAQGIGNKNNSITIDNSKIESSSVGGDTTIIGGNISISGTEITSPGGLRVYAVNSLNYEDESDYSSPFGNYSLTIEATADADNKITVSDSSLTAQDPITIAGGKVEISNSDITSSDDYLDILAFTYFYDYETGSGSNWDWDYTGKHTANSGNSVTIKNGSTLSGNEMTIGAGSINISDTIITNNNDNIGLIAANSADYAASSNYIDDQKIIEADKNNTIIINNSTINNAHSGNKWPITTIVGGQVQVTNNSTINSGDFLSIVAMSKYTETGETVAVTANTDNSVNLGGSKANGYGAVIGGGKIDISNTNITSANGSLELYAVESLTHTFNPDNSVTIKSTAGVGNTLNISGGSSLNATNSYINIYGGKIALSNSAVNAGLSVDVEAFTDLYNSSYGSKNLTAATGNSITMGNSAISAGSDIWMGAGSINGAKMNITAPEYIGLFAAKSLKTTTAGNGVNLTADADSKIIIDNSEMTSNNNTVNILGGQVQLSDSAIDSDNFYVTALSERNADADYRKSEPENSVTITKTNLVADNYNSGSEVFGGKVQITDSNITANGALDIFARSGRQGDTNLAGVDNSLTLENVKINSYNTATIRGGKMQITDSEINTTGSLNMLAFSERNGSSFMTAGTDNSLTLENVEINSDYEATIMGGKVAISNSDITAGDYLDITAFSELSNNGTDTKFTATSDNSITLNKANISSLDSGLVAGSIKMSDTEIKTTYGNMHLFAVKSMDVVGDLDQITATADANNNIIMNNSSITTNTAGGTYSNRIRGMAGAIDLNNSRLTSHGVGLAAFEEMKIDQSANPYDTYFNDETISTHTAGNNVTLQGGSSIVAGSGVQILGSSINVDNSNIAASDELGVSLNAMNKRLYSDNNKQFITEHNSKNIIEIGNGASITNTHANGEIMLLGGVINNNGTVNANNGSVAAIALSELKDNGTLEGAGGVIAFSGKDMAAGDYDYTYKGQTITITVKMDNPDKPQSTWETTWGADGKNTIYLKSVLPPEEIDKDTPTEEVIKSIDDVMGKLDNPATKDEALQEIETIFTNIQGKSAEDKKEIVDHLMGETPDNEKKDVAQAIINGDGGDGAFNELIEASNNETTKETNTQNQPGQPGGQPGAPQQTPGNEQPQQPGADSEIAPGVSVEN